MAVADPLGPTGGLEAPRTKVDPQIYEHVQAYQEAIALCITIPGIEEGAAANLLAEIGTNMDQFPSAQH